MPWYDLLAAVVSFACLIYVAVRFPALSELVSQRPWDGLFVAAIVIVLILEGLRRTTGNGLLYTTIFFFCLALIAGSLPGEFAAKSIPPARLTYFSVWDSTAILGVTLKIVSTVVVIFVLFGHVLLKSGGAAYFTDISMALMGRYRGGPAKIAIVGSSLFGTISGNAVSNVLTIGIVTIPLMVRVGFRPHLAAAIEANASTGGQLMPPVMGIAAFVMAEFLQVPYADVALAALIPALLFYIALFIQVDLEAARSNILPMDASQIPRLKDVLKSGWHFPIPFIALDLCAVLGRRGSRQRRPDRHRGGAGARLGDPVQGQTHRHPGSLRDAARHRAFGDRSVHDRRRVRHHDRRDQLFRRGLHAQPRAHPHRGGQPDPAPHGIGGCQHHPGRRSADRRLLHPAGHAGGADPDPDGHRADGRPHVHSLLRLPVAHFAAGRGGRLRRRQSRGRRPQPHRLGGDGVRLDDLRHPVPVRLFRHPADERRPDLHRHRLRHRGGRRVVHLRGGDGLFAAADRAARPRSLRRRRHLPAAAGRSLRSRPLVQHCRGHHGASG